MKRILFALIAVMTHAFAITDVGGVIATNTVWGPTGNPPDTVYNIVLQIFVPDSVTLTVQPGVRIQSSFYGFIVDGRIAANGMIDDSIRFTSSHTTPNPGDWDGFFFAYSVTDSSYFNYCIIEYADYGLDNGSLVEIRNSMIRKCIHGTAQITRSIIVDCEFSDNAYGGIGIGIAFEDSMECVIGGNLISNNNIGIFYSNRVTLPEFCAPNYFADNDTGIYISWSNIEVDGLQEWNPAVGGIDCYLYADITIAASGKLTIVPGNSFKFHYGGFHVEGQMVASGTPNDSITFTSANPIPNQGDWLGIWFEAYCPDTSVFEYCTIEYGYEFINANGTPLRIENSIIRHQLSGILTNGNVSVSNCEFSQNIQGIGCACYPESLDILISNSNFNNNHHGIYVVEGYNKLPNFPSPNQFSNNDFDITLGGSKVIKDSVMWNPSADSAKCFIDGFLTIDTTGTFTIAPGNIFKLWGTIWVHGQLVAQGTEQSKIVFTSRQNNPAPGDWDQISFFAEAKPGIMEHCIVEYADWGVGCYNDSTIIRNCEIRYSNRGVTIVSISGIIENCQIYSNDWFGILVSSPISSESTLRYGSTVSSSMDNRLDNDTVMISHNLIINNETGVLCMVGGNPVVQFNEIFGNTEWGMLNEDNNYWIYAENNWWGDSTGPRDTSDIDTLYNPNGLGDRVSDHVDYDPWVGFTACEEDPKTMKIVESTAIQSPHPNPFFNTIILSYDLAEKQHVMCTVYNALGQAVRKLCNMEQSTGKYRLFWNGKDSLGRLLPAGVYWLRFETPVARTIHKIVKIE